MKTTLLILTVITTQTMAQNELRDIRQGARDVRGTARDVRGASREVKGAVKETKAMTSEIRGGGETESSSPAKSYIKKFWEYIEKMEAAPNDLNILGTNSRAAATSINNIKTKDKSYDVAPLEAELKKWQQAYEEVRNGGSMQRTANNDLAGLVKLLYDVNTNVAQQEIENKTQELAQYKAKTAELVAMNLDPTDKMNAAILSNVKSRVTADLRTIDSNVKLWEKNMNMIVDERPARAYYLMIQYELAHWDALRKGPFAEKAELEAGYTKMNDMVNRLGSLEGIIAKGEVRKKEIVKNTKMPPALLQNAEMEKVFRQAFEDAGWGEAIVKIHLLDRDWKAIRNEVTGVLEARTQRAAIAAKDKQGQYILYNFFTIQQDYLGNGFSSQSKIIFHESMEILPENIK